tara:strand:+ start:126 stop:416 length:291 start_codon:yes stop_codon:yes gene_type:complete
MKKQNLIKKMIIALVVFIISTQSVNANENKIDELSQKFNHFLNCFKKNIETEVEETKDFQIKKWKEAKDQNRKTFKLVQNKLSGFFSDFPNPKGDR